MDRGRNRNFAPLLVFGLLGIAGILSATLLLESVGRSQEELVRLRVALARYEEPDSREIRHLLDREEWFDAAEHLLPAAPGAKAILSSALAPEEARPDEIAAANAWIDAYRERNGRAITVLLTLLMLTALLLALLIYRAGRLVLQVIGERGSAMELASRFNRTHEFERSRVARELEGQVARELSSVALRLRDRRSAGEEEILQSLNRSITRVRYLSYRMREPDRLGEDLGGLISSLCQDFSKETGISARCNSEGVLRSWFGRAFALHVYRIAQELLINAASHSRAQNVEIELSEEGERFRLRYQDDGVGVPGEAAGGAMGIGLADISDRAQLLGGGMTLSGEKGTEIVVILSLES